MKGVRTGGSDTEAVGGAEAGSVGSLDAPSNIGGDAGAAAFAAVLRMLDRLPLTDAERAETVRRLLADQTAKGKP